jgi:GntR family transcriptional regulator
MKGAPQIAIDLAAGEPAYRQIASQLRMLLLDGSFKPGDELPGVRRLSIDLGVHFNTVAEAYRQLAAGGWVDVSHGKPARVLKREKASPEPQEVERFRLRLRQLAGEMRAAGFSAARVRQELRNIAEAVQS